MTLKVVTANRLTDGLVVFLGPDGAWHEYIDRAAVADKDAADGLLDQGRALAARQQVVEPYLIDVTAGEGGLRPVRYREAIRSLGPSVRRDLGQQAAAVQ